MAKMVMYNLRDIRKGRQVGMLCYPKMILLEPKWKSNSLFSVPTTLIFFLLLLLFKTIGDRVFVQECQPANLLVHSNKPANDLFKVC